jgi:tetratricopeptide (TPR) repeat protein
MRNKFWVYNYFTLLITVLATSVSSGQNKINVAFKPFQYYANDTLKLYLAKKLPALICGGINTNSFLNYTVLQDSAQQDYLYADLDYKVLSNDRIFIDRYKEKFTQKNIRFFFEGAISISDQQFSISINGTDFIQTVTYQSGLRPITELADVIDKACSNLNFQVANILSVNQITKVAFFNFSKNYVLAKKGKQISDPLDEDFPVKYLLNNLKSDVRYIISPDVGKPNEFGLDTSKIYLSGNVKILENGMTNIAPVIYFNKNDSLNLQPVQANTNQKDSLLLSTTENIQTTLDALFSNGNLKVVKTFLRRKNQAPQEYEHLINEALKANQLILAYFYAEQLAMNYENPENNSNLFKGEIFYKENKFDDAISSLTEFLKIKKTNTDARYYLGLSYLKIGRYDLARKLLESIDPGTSAYDDLYYQLGICFYNLGAPSEALKRFKFQELKNKQSDLFTSYYIAICNKALGNWEEGLKIIESLYRTDTINRTVVKNYLDDYYTDFAAYKFKQGNYPSAADYFAKSYNLEGKPYSLNGQLKAIIYQNSADSTISRIVQKGIALQAFKTDVVYLDIAKSYEKAYDLKRDSSLVYKAIKYRKIDYNLNKPDLPQHYRILGFDYLRINRLDSAVYYYKQALKIEDNLSNYLNLAEAEIITFNLSDAMTTLNKMDQKFRLTTVQYRGSGEMSSLLLYYFFKSQIQALKKKNFDAEVASMAEILKTYKDYKDGLLNDWSFRVYYTWLIHAPKIEDPMRKQMLAMLCPLIPISGDKNLPCAINHLN